MNLSTRLAEIVGEASLITSRTDCLSYSRDMSIHIGIPDYVVFVETIEQITKILKLCYEANIPVVARGGGTSVTGAALPIKGGVLLNLIRMNQILEINLSDHYVRVQPGVICETLNNILAQDKFFFPPDPGSSSIATIGGMINTNASGIRAIKYGTTKNFVMGLTIVLADGQILKTGSRAPKNSSGYDLTHLFCTSEGTLGIVAEATLKILPLPEYTISARLDFPDITKASAAVTEMLSSGIPISTCEILDDVSINVLKEAIGLKLSEKVGCLIMMEIDGHRTAVIEYMNKVNTIAKRHSIVNKNWTDDPALKAPLWEARHRLVPAMSSLKSGYRLIPLMEDFGVPMTKIPNAIKEIQSIGNKYEIPIATFGHIGDGNLHATFIINVKDLNQWKVIKKIVWELVDLTTKMDGTISAEHGLGIAKAPYINREIGTIGITIMQAIKDALDPKDILNPGKLGLRGSINDIDDSSSFEPFTTGSSQVHSFGEIDDEIIACIQCGFCRLECPTYAASDLEALNARGRITYAFYLLTGQAKPNAEIATRLYQCMLCLNCKYSCPAKINVASIVQKARERLVKNGFLPKIFKKPMSDMIDLGNPFSQTRDKRTDSYPNNYIAKATSTTLLHLGCSASYQDIKIIPSVIKILNTAGVDYTTMNEKENCCGYLAYLVGDMNTFHKLVDSNLKLFKKAGIQKILTTCAGCHKTFTELYSCEDFKISYQSEHMVTYIEKLIIDNKLTFKTNSFLKVAYHDPCDLGRHLGIYEPPRNVIKALPGINFIEFPQNRSLAKCCGGGAGVKAFAPSLVNDIAFARIKTALSLDVDIVVSACPACKISLNQAAAHARKEKIGKIKILDLTELVALMLI